MPGSKKEKGDGNLDRRQLISTLEAAEISGFTQRHVRHLLRTGEIWGQKLGRDWFTTSKAVREYLARDRKPGPKRNEGTAKPKSN